jgi:hypothetical protein
LLWVDGGLVHGRFLPGAEVCADDARENVAVTRELTAGQRRPVLVDLRAVRSQTAEARAYLAGPEATRVSLAVALLIASPLSRAIGNFYLGFNRPEVPTRLFTDEAAALLWLAAADRGEAVR